MSHAEHLAEADKVVEQRVKHCHEMTRSLISELQGLLRSRAEDVLNVDQNRIMKLAMDVVDRQALLRSAYDSQQRIARRNI